MSSWWTCAECGEEWYGSGHTPCPNPKNKKASKSIPKATVYDAPIVVIIAAAGAANVALMKGSKAMHKSESGFMLLAEELLKRGVDFSKATATVKETGK